MEPFYSGVRNFEIFDERLRNQQDSPTKHLNIMLRNGVTKNGLENFLKEGLTLQFSIHGEGWKGIRRHVRYCEQNGWLFSVDFDEFRASGNESLILRIVGFDNPLPSGPERSQSFTRGYRSNSDQSTLSCQKEEQSKNPDLRLFAALLVEELVHKKPTRADSRRFHRENGLHPNKMDDADEIWRYFVRYNIETLGVKSVVATKYWNLTLPQSILKQRTKLLDSIVRLRNLEEQLGLRCCKNYTKSCSMTYRKGEFGFPDPYCLAKRHNQHCPVAQVTQTLTWHRQHYTIAKIIVECASRLLLNDEFGKKEGNLNHIYEGICRKYDSTRNDFRFKITEEFISRFKDIRGYSYPAKVIVWMLSDLSSPVHCVNHWPNIDLSQLVPVDVHVKRLSARFGFVAANEATGKNIMKRLAAIYPDEPRKLDFALYRLGAEGEEFICRETPECGACRKALPLIFNACLARKRV